jgi:peptide/nickel transport system substrate-binding protein
MDFRAFDRARRQSGPLELDLVESYARGSVSRREFVRRGTLIGLSLPFMSAIISACGSDNGGSSGTTAGGSAGTSGGTQPAGTTGAGTPGGTIKVASQKPAGPLDPVAMQDLGTYGIIAQSFEYLATLGDNDIAPGLAEKWSPNADGSEWTFELRKGVKWQDGTDFTSADVAATMDRMVDAGNSGLKGIIEKGAVDASDPNVAVFTLTGPNGNFPYLVSVYNPQCCITPKDYASGTTLDGTPNGTGPFKLSKFDSASGATFVRNDSWWGGKTPLDASEWLFFDELGAMVTTTTAGEADAIVQFQVIGGDALFSDSNFEVLAFQAATHRQVWMRCDTGQFTDKKVRQALAYTFDRPQMIKTLFRDKADLGNDHVIAPLYPFFYDGLTQRERDVEKAKALLQEAGVATPLKATLHFGDLQEIPQLAQIIQVGAKDGGFDLQLAGESLDTFYDAQWCPKEPADPPCSGAAELGIVDYGHRATPDVYLNAALATNGIWNSSQYSSPEFDAAFKEYQSAVGVDAQTAACQNIETILNEDVPVGLPYFYNYLSGHNKNFQGVRVSALGQMYLDQASKV